MIALEYKEDSKLFNIKFEVISATEQRKQFKSNNFNLNYIHFEIYNI